ncbi:MAG: NYN domain-containing protein [Candidatus Hodarchaeales archaeon]
MQKLIEYSRIKSRSESLIFLLFLSSIGFTLIAFFSMQILLKINESKIQFDLSGGEVFILLILLIPFITGGFFSLILDRSLLQEKFQKTIFLNHCIVCMLPLKNKAAYCKHCDSSYHSWHHVNNEYNITNECIICGKLLLDVSTHMQTESENVDNLVVLDGTNLACDNKPPSMNNIKVAQELLISEGFESICIVSPALKYRILEKEEFLKEIHEGNFIQSPAGSYDDRYIIETAMKFNAYILSNDKFSDLKEYRDDVKKRRMTFTFIRDEIIIDFNNSTKKTYRDNLSN